MRILHFISNCISNRYAIRFQLNIILIIRMVKYLFGLRNLPIALLLLFVVVTFNSKAPVPNCNAPKFSLSDLPISLNQKQTYNLNDYFSGYNLNLTILNKPEFVTMRQKIVKLKQFPKNQPGLRNYHLAHEGNNWGKTLVTLSVFGNDTVLRWGMADASETIPQLTYEAVVTNDSHVACFDAVWIPHRQIALVDCIQNGTFGLKNYFYYINTTSKDKLGKVFNDMYVPFTHIYHRKIRLHSEQGSHFLIRAFFAEHVDDFDHNTYLQILSIDNPMKPWTIRVMDRSFLQQDKLSVMDFQVYNGDIYLLDYHSGVIKFDITKAQTIVIKGRYRTDSGFTKLGVYTNYQDDSFLMILAHDHALFEIDWSNQIKPEIITKYSIPDGSRLHDIWVNDKYVIAQLTANLTRQKGDFLSTQSTYIFSRGSRTYLNAYAAIPHPNYHAFVDFQRDTGQMLTIDTDKISVYQVSAPTIYVNPMDKSLLSKQFKFIVKADSRNQYTNESISCSFTFAFLVVPDDSLAIWPTGLTIPSTYYANYPGNLYIPIDRYVLGSNITYGVSDEYDKDPPVYYFFHQNQTIISWWDKKPSNFKYTFLRTEQYDSLHESTIYVYTQNFVNDTHFSQCITVEFTKEVHCFDSGYAPHLNFRIANITANRFHYYQGKYIHLAAILFESFPNEVFIYDVENEIELGTRPIMFDQGYEGKIQSIEFIGQFLIVVLRYIKEIVIYDMVQCWDHQERDCQQLYRINAKMMFDLGIKYFAPIQVYASDFHPSTLFIQCIDRVIIISLTRRGPVKLAQIMSPATQEPGFYKWKMGIARGELILVNPPNTIEQHDLDQIYQTRDAPKTKSFPTFGYQIPDKFDLDFSDQGNMIYITAKDLKLPVSQSSVILVYKTGLPAVSSLYDVFNLNLNYDDILIDATGSFSDYITVTFGSILLMFRQYEIPILVFQDSFLDFSFNITYQNRAEQRPYNSTRTTVKIANYPQDILINDTSFNGDVLTNTINYGNGDNQRYEFNDSTWFNGSILSHDLIGCSQCGNRIKVENHVQYERTIVGIHDMVDYVFAASGGYIQQTQSIITLRHNSSIHQFISLPSSFNGETCITIEHNWVYDYTVSACKNGNEVYLYTTYYNSFKPFVAGPQSSSAKHVIGLGITQDLLMVVDVDEKPWQRDRQGSIIIYAINHDPFEPEIFDQIEVINTDDLQAAQGWPEGRLCFIGNAHFSYTNNSDTYRLVITQLYNGFFVLDFKWVRGRKSAEILNVQFIDLKEQLAKINYPLPNMAHFTGVAINREFYSKDFGYWQTNLIIVTSNFHSFEITMHIDIASSIVIHQITRIYYRYGFYETQNYIKTFDGYFVTAQRLPSVLETFDWYSKLVLTVYDSKERWQFGQQKPIYAQGTSIPISFMLGGAQFKKGSLAFDWNFTMVRNSSDPFRRLGLVVLHSRDAQIQEFSVHDRLHIITQPGISQSQDVTLRVKNDYHQLDIKFKVLVDDNGLPGWAIALIVIGSVGIAAAIGYIIFLKFVKGKKPNRQSEAQKSLLQREGEDDDDQESSSQQEGQEESSGSGSGEQQLEQQNQKAPDDDKAEKKSQAVPSINRETVTSVDEGEAKVEQQQNADGEEQNKEE